MPSKQPISTTNRLLTALPSKDRQHLLASCEPVDLKLADVLVNPDDPIRYVYFPTDCVISVVTPINGPGLEVGLIGNEGMLGITLMLGVNVAPFHALVQRAGSAQRILAPLFLRELKYSSALQRGLKRYLYVIFKQLAQTVACNRFHQVETRLAHWLLMAQDRVHSDNFHITQLSLSSLLGVRRVGITNAANSLQKQKLISYRRGDITIIDRVGLEAASCECYQTEKEIYERILGQGTA